MDPIVKMLMEKYSIPQDQAEALAQRVVAGSAESSAALRGEVNHAREKERQAAHAAQRQQLLGGVANFASAVRGGQAVLAGRHGPGFNGGNSPAGQRDHATYMAMMAQRKEQVQAEAREAFALDQHTSDFEELEGNKQPPEAVKRRALLAKWKAQQPLRDAAAKTSKVAKK